MTKRIISKEKYSRFICQMNKWTASSHQKPKNILWCAHSNRNRWRSHTRPPFYCLNIAIKHSLWLNLVVFVWKETHFVCSLCFDSSVATHIKLVSIQLNMAIGPPKLLGGIFSFKKKYLSHCNDILKHHYYVTNQLLSIRC